VLAPSFVVVSVVVPSLFVVVRFIVVMVVNYIRAAAGAGSNGASTAN
jgi:hypothetical protein